MKSGILHTQQGFALALTLIMLGVGSIIIVPTLQYAVTALNNQSINRDDFWTFHALEAVTQQALWELQYDTDFADCTDAVGNPITDSDGIDEAFVDCVTSWGSWTLATVGELQGIDNETQVDQVNRQDVSVKVEVPGALTAAPDPTPTLIPGFCLYAWVSRDTDLAKAGDQTWVQIGEPIYYTVHIVNCSSSPASFNLRRLIAILPEGFSYEFGTTGLPRPVWGDTTTLNPEESRCDGTATAPDPDYTYCTVTDDRLLLAWPSATANWAGSNAVQVNPGATLLHTFTASPSSWGVFFVEVTVCYFAAATGDPGPCIAGNQHKTGKVAPVIVGMFNIQGNGKGNAFGASAKLDNGGADLVSID